MITISMGDIVVLYPINTKIFLHSNVDKLQNEPANKLIKINKD